MEVLGDYLDQDPTTEEESENVLIEYLKEKDSLKNELKNKDKEIQKYKAKVYDLSHTISDLETKVTELEKEKQTHSSRQAAANVAAVRPNTARRTPQVQRARSAKQRGKQLAPTSHSVNDKESPKVTGANSAINGLSTANESENKGRAALLALEKYTSIAKKHPDLKFSVILSSEKFFEENDMNGDGMIDDKELEIILTKQGHLFTDKQLKEIMEQVDEDNDGSIEFMEYLAVVDRLQQRKRVNLPQSLTKSSACNIQ